jgi:hypothetical protein
MKQLEDWKNGLLKSVSLLHATISNNFKKSLYLKVEQNEEEIFEKSQILKI